MVVMLNEVMLHVIILNVTEFPANLNITIKSQAGVYIGRNLIVII